MSCWRALTIVAALSFAGLMASPASAAPAGLGSLKGDDDGQLVGDEGALAPPSPLSLASRSSPLSRTPPLPQLWLAGN